MSWRYVATTIGRWRTLACVAFACGALAAASGGAQEPAPAPQDALRERVIDDLRNGRDLRPLWAQTSPSNLASGVVTPPGSDLGADIGSLAAGLRRTARTTDTGSERDLVSLLERLAAEDLLVERELEATRARLPRSGVLSGRAEAAAARYRAWRNGLFGPLGGVERWRSGEEQVLPAGAKATIAAAGAAAAGEALVPLRAQLLPFGPAALPPRPPRTTPRVVPSYAAGSVATGADLASTPEAPLSPAILHQAALLGHDYVRIFELVRNGIRTEWYAGAMKGAEGTLLQGAGNDVDQAALLVALLRASNAPARFVHGVVELPLAAAAADLGLRDASRVPAALRAAGVAHTPVVRGGRVAAVQVEHTWVSALVPYANYRGVVVDVSGKSWLPLAPALKGSTWTGTPGVLHRMHLDAGAAVASYLGAPQAVEPLVQLRQQVEAFLAANGGGSFEEQVGGRTIVAQQLGMLPSSLPFDVVAVTGEEAKLSADRQQTLVVRVRTGDAETDPLALSASVPVLQVAGRRFTLSYQPATADDQDAVDAWGGLDAVPAYLVHLRPQLKLGGRPLAMGSDAVEMGKPLRLELELRAPGGSVTVAATAIAGGYQALGVSVQQGTPAGDATGAADTERPAAGILGGLGATYASRWSAAEEQLAGLLDIAVVRPLPALAIVDDAVRVDTLVDLPYRLRWQGVTVDAALRVAEPIDRGADAGARAWTLLAGLAGSALERFVLEDQLRVAAVSADSGMGLAAQAGLAVHWIDAGNVDTLLPTLDHPAAVRTEIADWVRRGNRVQAPAAAVSRHAWQGSVWRVEDPDSGGGGYFLAGGLAGGATAERPEAWLLPFLVQVLGNPYAAVPNTNPLAAAEVRKVPATDWQEGTVGQPLRLPLTAFVRDAAGRPVQGALVTFSVVEGGGTLVDAQGNAAGSVQTVTNGLGIAAAALKAGERTDARPYFVHQRAGDAEITRALLNLVEVEVAALGGSLVTDEPFYAVAYPGPLATLRHRDGQQTHFIGVPGISVQAPLALVAEDSFGNPISNVPVQLSVDPVFRPPGCSNAAPAADVRNAVVYDARFTVGGELRGCPGRRTPPVLGECGSAQLSLLTGWTGAVAGVILGNDVAALYAVRAKSGAHELRFTYATVFVQAAGDRCSGDSTFTQVHATPALYVDGNPVDATFPLIEYPRPIEAQLYYWRTGYRLVPGDPEPRLEPLTTGEWRLTTGVMAFEAPGSSVRPTTFRAADKTFETRVTPSSLGPTPVVARVSAIDVGYWFVVGGEVAEGFERLPSTLHPTALQVWGVGFNVTAVEPILLPITLGGRSGSPLLIHYAIFPTTYGAGQVVTSVEEEVTGDVRYVTRGQPRSAEGTGVFPRGLPFDIDRTYAARITLNGGLPGEMTSTLAYPVRLTQSIFAQLPGDLELSQDVDLASQHICPQQQASVHFTTTQLANVTLAFRKVEAMTPEGELQLGPEIRLLDNSPLAEGGHDVVVEPEDLPAGDYLFQLRGTSLADGHEDVTPPTHASSGLRERNSRALAHSLVDDVDLFDGHLNLQREDFAVAGRVPLSFRRAYSGGGAAFGVLGIGWTHNWDVRLEVTPCHDVLVQTGDSGAVRFVDDGAGGYRPLPGHHGTLVRNAGDSTFDFYAKGGTRYHFKPAGTVSGGWLLDSVEDTNGNLTELTYGAGSGTTPLLRQVKDTRSGRALELRYARRTFPLWTGDVLTEVSGPLGLHVSFGYDAFGRLVHAQREDEPLPSPHASASETYAYDPPRFDVPDSLGVLRSAHDDVDGSTVAYDYQVASVGVATPDLSVVAPRQMVRRVQRRAGGEVTFEYDLERLQDRTGELVTRVRDPRQQETAYHLNQYGAAVRVVDPLQHQTITDWDLEHLRPRAVTDRNGSTTTYGYDAAGNRTLERVQATDVDGQLHVYDTVSTYWPPGSFAAAPFAKDRLHTRTDRDGHVTTYEYDDRGNLAHTTLVVELPDGTSATNRTSQTYYDNGDRQTTTDARGITTGFTYDAYGNVSSETAALHTPAEATTTVRWNARSLPLERTDAEGRTTRFEHDTLGRLLRQHVPRVPADVEDPVVETVYDDANRTRTEIDLNGHATTTLYDAEGRPLEITAPTGATKHLRYDLAGNKTLESNWFDATTLRHDTTFVYDAAGRLSDRTEPLGRLTHYDYDAEGNLIRETLSDTDDASFQPRIVEHDYDELHRAIRHRRFLSTENGPQPVVRGLGYDGEGHVVLERDALLRERRHRYDALGRRIETVGPEWDHEEHPGDPTWTQWFYDGNGNLEREVRHNSPADQVRDYVYDEHDRLKRRRDAATLGWSELAYDRVGNLKTEIDARLDQTSYTYDARDRRLSKSHHLDRVTVPARTAVFTYEHDAAGNLIAENQPNGNTVVHEYDATNRLRVSRDSVGALVLFTYDANGNVKTSTDANGRTTTNHYDALARLESQELPAERTTSTSYDVAGNRLSTTDPGGHTTRFEYDTLDRPVKTVDPAPLLYERRFGYDLAGNKKSETDRRGNTTDFDYDDNDRLVRVLLPPLSRENDLRYETRYRYDAVGNRTAETDRRGIKSVWRYDAENRLSERLRDGISLQRIVYDPAGNKKLEYDGVASHQPTGYDYDERNLLVAVNRPLGAVTRYELDLMGDVEAETDGEGHTSRRAYDLRRRLKTETNPADEATHYEYDSAGNRTAMVRPRSAEAGAEERFRWEYRYDDADRLRFVEDPLGHVTEHRYDLDGNRKRQIDANGHETAFAYDELHRLRSLTYPDLQLESYGYDADGNEISRVTPLGAELSAIFDELSRRVAGDYPVAQGADEVSHEELAYDGNGNVVQVVESFSGPTGTRTSSRTYDRFDRVATATDAFGKALIYTYDNNGNRATLKDPDGKVTVYTFDDLNRTRTVTTPAGVTTYEYFRDSRLKGVSYPNGTAAAHTYDLAGRLETLRNIHGPTVVSSYDYTYDDNGNRSQQLETNGGAAETTTYTYDDADRLTGVEYPDQAVTYTYDPVGNRLTEKVASAGGAGGGALLHDKTYTYNDRDQVIAVTDAADPTENATYTFDANGNQTGKTSNDLETRFTFDTRDRLVLAERRSIGGGSSFDLLGRYLYDWQGLRVEKLAAEGDVRYTYDDQSVLLQSGADGVTIAKYDYGPDRLLSLNHRTEGRSFYLFDALGSPVDLIASEGTARARNEYDAWGVLRRHVGDSANPFGFTGHERDEETGLYYARTRFYDPELGRFLSEDPWEGLRQSPPSLHRYLYAHDNPLIFVDPTGMCVLGLPCPKAVRDRVTAFKGYAKGVALVVAAPGILTYNLTGAAVYNVTGGHQYRAQAEATGRLLDVAAEAVQSPQAAARLAAEGLISGVQQMADAANTGDYEAFGEGLGFTVGQVAMIGEAGTGMRLTATPEMALSTVAGRSAQAGGRLVLTMTPNSLGAAAILSSSVANEGSEHPPDAQIVKESTSGLGTEIEPLATEGAPSGVPDLPPGWNTTPSLGFQTRSLEFNVAPHGKQPTPRSPFASHHGVQKEYLRQNVPGYEAADDPTILLDNRAGAAHPTITGEQATFRADQARATGNPYGGDYGTWRAEAIEQMQRNGVPNEAIIRWLQEHEGYLFEIDGL